VAPPGHKDVRGLDVAMDDALFVRSFQRVSYLNRQVEQKFEFDGFAADAVLEGLALEKLHGDEVPPVGFPNFIDGADVGMVEGGSGTRFTAEALECLGISGQVFREKFQRDVAPEAEILGLVDHAHPAAAELL